jgi:hypothetical protein
MEPSSILTLLVDSQHNCMTNTCCCVYGVETPDGGQQISPKHVVFFTKISLTNSAV